jgi:hypothetical protein
MLSPVRDTMLKMNRSALPHCRNPAGLEHEGSMLHAQVPMKK